MSAKPSKGAEKIRYYVYGLIREHRNESVMIPSSYELAERFGVTRRVAQYELESLIRKGLLIGKHRIGTFTNPLSSYVWFLMNEETRPLIGTAYGSGDFFAYSYNALLLNASLYKALAENNCIVHDLHVISKLPQSMAEEILPLNLRALVWQAKIDPGIDELLHHLNEKFPVVTYGFSCGGISSVVPDYDKVFRKLDGIFKQEKRKTVFSILSDQVLAKRVESAFPDRKVHHLFQTGECRDAFERMEEVLKSGVRPDAVFCEDGFVAAAEKLCRKFGIDTKRECRLVSVYAYRSDHEFTGYSIHPDFERMADAVVHLIRGHLAGKEYIPETIEIEPDLRAWGMKKNSDGQNIAKNNKQKRQK